MTDPLTDYAVSCRGLGKSFALPTGPVIALDHTDLDVRRGELMMVVGPSGCGKTSLISIVAALMEPDQGTCHVAGQDLSQLKARQKARFRRNAIGFVFQSFNLIPTITIQQNVAVPLILAGADWRRSGWRAAELLERLGLGQRLTAMPRELSGGQQQRVAIARAIVHDPALIVCDEPTSALDHATGQLVLGILRDLTRESGKSLLVVTHDSRIFRFADRIAEMNDGRVVQVGRPVNVKRDFELELQP
jgi:putative ABC transport system ATP-binding protein